MNLLDHCIIPDWPAPPNVKALQTTRHGGVSVAPYDSLNLGDHVGDAPLAVARNRQLLAAAAAERAGVAESGAWDRGGRCRCGRLPAAGRCQHRHASRRGMRR